MDVSLQHVEGQTGGSSPMILGSAGEYNSIKCIDVCFHI